MKLSWSYRITFLYLGFVGIIVTLVTISSRNKEELVAKDYYAQELRYQDKINAINNEKALAESISHQVDESSITLMLPAVLEKEISGEINFYCPADSKKDISFKMMFNKEGKQVISKSKVQRGIYKLRLSWNVSGKSYFKEEVITIN
ncbi:MAG: FixH family protein [Bacteroidia bacterium]